jgi:hypothetical protein
MHFYGATENEAGIEHDQGAPGFGPEMASEWRIPCATSTDYAGRDWIIFEFPVILSGSRKGGV